MKGVILLQPQKGILPACLLRDSEHFYMHCCGRPAGGPFPSVPLSARPLCLSGARRARAEGGTAFTCTAAAKAGMLTSPSISQAFVILLRSMLEAKAFSLPLAELVAALGTKQKQLQIP